MKTRYKTALVKRFVIICMCLLPVLSANAQVDAPGQIWQWSVAVNGGMNGQGLPHAYMWIPENCSKVRGMVLAQNNMEEFSILENQQFRDSLASIGFGEIWVAPAFSPYFNVQEGAKEIFLQMIQDLADASGYPEVYNVPMVPMGHSAMANFPFAFSAGLPERALCGVSVSGTFPYDYGNAYCANTQCGATSDYIPQLVCNGEYEGAGDASTNYTKIFNRRAAHPLTPMSHLPCSGEFHFATSQRKTNFIANYIKKAAYYRLAADATGTSLATLTPINPTTTGWLCDRWRKDMPSRYPAAPVASYTGKMAAIGTAGEENFWYFDQDMAQRVESFKNTYFRKTPCLLAYNQSTTPGLVGAQVPQTNNHVQCTLAFTPLNDSLDFELSSSFLTTIPAASTRCAGWMATTNPTTGVVTNGVVGATITYPADNSLSVIDREIGPLTKLRKDPVTGITTFRMTLERGLGSATTNYQQYCIFSLAHPGDAIYKASVLQADMSIAVTNTAGLAQTITFPQIANVANATATVPLNATSSLGMPVQYFVNEGPAKIVNGKIVFTTVPQGTKFPVKVTVVAWQWGRNAALAARMTSAGSPYPGQTIQTASQVTNTFYITGRLTPQVDLSLTAAKPNSSVVHVNWLTNSEVNTSNFEVQRSTDNTTWNALGTVMATNSVSPYTYDDTNPVSGTTYYRLKLTSADGTLNYSSVVSVNDGFTTSVLSSIGNELILVKVQNAIQIKGGINNSNLVLTIYDNMGRAIFVKSDKFSSGGIVVTPLPDLAKGVYIVRVMNNDQIKSLKILID